MTGAGARPFVRLAPATLALGALLAAPGAAQAHAFVGDGGPAAGMLHPLTGVDHLLAMLMVGVLSAQLGGRAIRMMPSAFVVAVVLGVVLGAAGAHVPGVEIGIALSVVSLGAAGALGLRVPLAIATVLAAAFGLYHGVAHGAELPYVRTQGLYVAGFVATTAGLHLIGALGGLLVLCRPNGSARLRAAGVLVGAAGLVLVAREIGRLERGSGNTSREGIVDGHHAWHGGDGAGSPLALRHGGRG